MIAIDLLPRFANLLDDEEIGLGLEDPFDVRLFVAADQDEVTVTDDERRAIQNLIAERM